MIVGVCREARSRLVVLGVVGVLALAACSSSAPSPGDSAPGTSTGVQPAPSGGLDVTTDTSLLPRPGQVPHFWAGLIQQQIAANPDWQVLSGAGVDAALGKVEDKIFGRLSSLAAAQTGAVNGGTAGSTASGAVVSDVRWVSGSSRGAAALAPRAGTPATPSVAEFAGLGVALGYAADATVKGVPPEGASGTVTDTVNGVAVSGTMTFSPTGSEMSVSLSKNGKTYSMTVKSAVTGDPCPDAEGKVSGSFEVSYAASGSSAAESGGGSFAAKATFEAVVDDNAEVASVVSDGSMIQNETVNGSTSSSSVGLHTTLDGGFQGRNVVTTFRSPGSDQAQADQLVSTARDALNGILLGLLTQRKNAWQSGRCVAVTADLPAKVKRASTTPFTVKVTHKPDGTALDAPVTAKLDSGAVSVSPDHVDKAPGQFTYVAPDAAGKKASLTFTSKSRRGIGTLTVSVSTMRYVASGGLGPVSISGTVDDLEQPFELKVTSPGATGTVTLTPTGPSSGKLQGTSTLGFSKEVTTGSYTLKETSTGYLATGTVRTCLTLVKTCSPSAQFEVTFTAE